MTHMHPHINTRKTEIEKKFSPEVSNEIIRLLFNNASLRKPYSDLNDHRECGIIVGDNLNWLINNESVHLFGVSGHSKLPEQSFTVACAILQENILLKRINPEDGVVLAVVLSAHTHDSFERKKRKLPFLVSKYSEIIKPFAHIAQLDSFQIISCVFCVETGDVFFQSHLNDTESAVSKFIIEKISDHISIMRQFNSPHLPALVVECMDPRVCLCSHTGVRAHRIVRTAGAKNFERKKIAEKIELLNSFAHNRSLAPFVISSYHFSNINPMLGCRGHSTVDQARNNALEIRSYSEKCGVSSVVVAVNTDIGEIGVHISDEDIVFSSEVV